MTSRPAILSFTISTVLADTAEWSSAQLVESSVTTYFLSIEVMTVFMFLVIKSMLFGPSLVVIRPV
ncbi:unannotated protein [freshwater metagenome]|uniref:Unannotated protein n=1 Tax=freshwater metagenome TaxID=449393 RepID=A0A6J6G2U5_9ZZZZ